MTPLRRSMVGFLNRAHRTDADTKFLETASFLLREHSRPKSIRECKQIHARLLISKAISEIYVANTVLSFYSRYGDFFNARLIFDQMPHKNVVTWTSFISALVHHGFCLKALNLFKKMLESSARPNQFTFSVTIRACVAAASPDLGLQVHGLIIRLGFERDGFAGSSLVDMYFKIGGGLEDACCIFSRLFSRDSVMWNVMISGFAQIGDVCEVLRLLWEMWALDGLKPNDFTLTSLLKCCCLLEEIQQIHGLALKLGTDADLVVGSALVDVYGKCGSMEWSRKVLNSMELKDSFVWSSIISGYARNGSGDEAVCLFRDMCRQGMTPDQHALSSTLKACVETRDLETGVQVHTQMIKNGFHSDCFVGSALITLYSDCNKICEAQKLFTRIGEKDIVAWNSMILGYAQMEEESSYHCIKIFQELCQNPTLKPDGATIIAVLKSCQKLAGLETGIQVHTRIVKTSLSCDTRIGNAVINMYSKCGEVGEAYKAFIDIAQRDEISWSCIIGNYQQNGFELEALSLCKDMLAQGFYLTSFSFPLCIAACSELADEYVGKQFHAFAIKLGSDRDVYVGSSIIDMYAKCGFMDESQRAFHEQENPNRVTFNALISGFAQHGKALEAIGLFRQMEKMGLVPNQITFLAVLSACSHAGLVAESLFFFGLMHKKYNMKPESEHYSCLIDALSRAGRLEEAYQIIEIDGEVQAWRTLLSACRNYGNAEIAEKFARKLIQLDPKDRASYVLLSNLYSEEGKWEEAFKLRQRMRGTGAKKDPGSSWLMFRDQVH